jgi:hypothetical protein
MTTATRDLDEIFGRIEGLLRRYSPPLAARTGTVREKRDLHLWSEKEVEVAGRKREEVFFAGLIVQKGYVGFYFMPVYSDPDKKELFAPELLRLLKGKSCFHVRELDDELQGRIDDALERGFELYRERGWI